MLMGTNQPEVPMKRLAIVLPALFLFAIATDAQAGARIVTPLLTPESAGTLWCYVVNASDKKDVTVEMTIYMSDGTSVHGPFLASPTNRYQPWG
jgi:hypothetical protein